MIPIGVEIFVARKPIDLRSSFERLSGIVREAIGRDPRGRAMFVFFGRRRDAIKVLFHDGSGFCIFYKRLDRGVCRHARRPADASVGDGHDRRGQLSAARGRGAAARSRHREEREEVHHDLRVITLQPPATAPPASVAAAGRRDRRPSHRRRPRPLVIAQARRGDANGGDRRHLLEDENKKTTSAACGGALWQSFVTCRVWGIKSKRSLFDEPWQSARTKIFTRNGFDLGRTCVGSTQGGGRKQPPDHGSSPPFGSTQTVLTT